LRKLFVPAGLLALFVPIHGIAALGYLRGIAGDLSIPSLLLLASALVGLLGGPRLHDGRELEALAGFVLAASALLYPMALGLTAFDPYAYGYPGRERLLVVALSMIALVAWYRGLLLVVLGIALALAAFRLELLESRNLWDYLLDPWLVVSLVGFTIFARASKSR
jgi:hypothetical protein